MKKLVLHSDHVENNTQLEKAFIQLCSNNHNITIGYIPSQSDNEDRYWFNQIQKWYSQFGISDMSYFDIDKEYKPDDNDKLFACDAIYLSGGNTFYFLNNLKKRKLLNKLKDYVETGGILIGLSAGSIIMTKQIGISGFCDQNHIGLQDLSALGLADFEFYPHFEPDNKELINDLIIYSKKNQSEIYACQDGDGIIVIDDHIELFGKIYYFSYGKLEVIDTKKQTNPHHQAIP